jgi:hypothetical protein
MKIRDETGSGVVDVIIAAALIVFVILPSVSIVLEKFIIMNKSQIIKDAVDIANISLYNAINTVYLGKNVINMDKAYVEHIYRTLLAENLNLNFDLTPKENSIVDGEVKIESIIIYTGEFPLKCPDGTDIKRPSVHSSLTLPLKPSLFRQMLLDILGREQMELKVHVDSEIPVNN